MNYNKSPYKKIPDELINQYSMNGKITIIYRYFDSSRKKKIIWTKKLLDKYIKTNTEKNINNNIGISNYGPGIDPLKWILKSIKKYNISNKKVVVVGSTFPWIEALLLNFNNEVIIIEYNVPRIEKNNYKLKAKNYFEFEKENNNYDCIISFSSIEHSGLGRYGDPLNPEGDLETMNTIHNNLSNDGLLFLGIPVGIDVVAWNAHREYGRIRLPLLIKNFEEIEWVGVDKKKIDGDKHEIGYSDNQPLIILKKKI